MVTDMKVDGLIINKMVEVTERVKDIGTMSYDAWVQCGKPQITYNFFDGKAEGCQKEAAARLGWSIGKFRRHLHSARKYVKRELARKHPEYLKYMKAAQTMSKKDRKYDK